MSDELEAISTGDEWDEGGIIAITRTDSMAEVDQ